MPTHLQDIVGRTIYISHPVYEAEEEAYVDGWKPLPAEQGASDEQGYLFRVRWKTTPEAGEYDYFDLDKIHWTHPNSIGWDEDNALPSHPASALPSPPVSRPHSLLTSPLPNDNEQEAHSRAPSPSRSQTSRQTRAAPPGQNPESKKNHSVNVQDESLVHDEEDSDDSAYDDLPVLELLPSLRSKKGIVENEVHNDEPPVKESGVAGQKKGIAVPEEIVAVESDEPEMADAEKEQNDEQPDEDEAAGEEEDNDVPAAMPEPTPPRKKKREQAAREAIRHSPRVSTGGPANVRTKANIIFSCDEKHK